MFWVVVFRRVFGCFHLLHVGGPSHPNIYWGRDYGRVGSFNLRFKKYIVTILGVATLGQL